MKKWLFALMILAAACGRDKPAEPPAAPVPAVEPAVAPPAEVSPAALPAVPTPAAPAAVVPAAPPPVQPDALHPNGRGEGKGKVDPLPDEAPPASIPAPAGFSDPCGPGDKCPGSLVCYQYGDGQKRCTLKCKAHEDCPAGKFRNGCNGQGYCRHGATQPD